MQRTLAMVAAVTLIALAAAAPTEARGRVYFGLNVGIPLFYGPPAYYYPPSYYYPPPAYYYPPPPRVVYAPPAPPANCRTFQGDASIDASGQPFYGTACLQSDGRWHIVR